MSFTRRLIPAVAALAVLVAMPTTAVAKKSTSKASAAKSVKQNVSRADKAVKRMKRHARLGSSRGVARQLKIARSRSAAASRTARRMAARARTSSQKAAAARSLTLAGAQYDELVEAVTAIVDQVRGKTQAKVAKAIAPSLAGRQRVIDVLTQLLGEVPEQARPVLASIIAALAVGDATEIVNLNDALASGKLPTGVAGTVTESLGSASSLIDQAFGMIKSFVPLLPAAVQGPLTQILDMVTQTVGTIVPTVLQSVTALIDTILGSLPFATSTSPASGNVFGLGSLLGGLVGDGAQGLPGTFQSTLDSLLGGLFGNAPGGGSPAPAVGGIGAIISNVTAMISQLLGGLFGQVAPAT